MYALKTLMVIGFLLSTVFLPIENSYAHSTLDNATPEEGERVKGYVKDIILTFNTDIENGSTLFLINEEGEEITPNSLEVADKKLYGSFEEPLPPGTYQVNWKILGEDGHVIENQYSFTLTEEAGKSPEKKEENDLTSETEKEQKEEVKSNSSDTNDGTKTPGYLYGIIIFLLIASILLIVWMVFSKSKE